MYSAASQSHSKVMDRLRPFKLAQGVAWTFACIARQIEKCSEFKSDDMAAKPPESKILLPHWHVHRQNQPWENLLGSFCLHCFFPPLHRSVKSTQSCNSFFSFNNHFFWLLRSSQIFAWFCPAQSPDWGLYSKLSPQRQGGRPPPPSPLTPLLELPPIGFLLIFPLNAPQRWSWWARNNQSTVNRPPLYAH